MGNKTTLRDNGDEYNTTAGWKKSSYSASNGHCVETSTLTNGQIGIRDSKATNGNILHFEPEAWVSFTAAIRTA
jgi:hypothetical protein